MYVCKDCAELCDNPKLYTETHGFSDGRYESYYGCPSCGGALVETVECDGCGQFVIGDFVKTINGNVYCNSCYITHNILEE